MFESDRTQRFYRKSVLVKSVVSMFCVTWVSRHKGCVFYIHHKSPAGQKQKSAFFKLACKNHQLKFLFSPQLHIDATSEDVSSPTNKDVDFFKQHEDEATKLSDWTPSVPTTTPQSIPVSNGTLSKETQLVGMYNMYFQSLSCQFSTVVQLERVHVPSHNCCCICDFYKTKLHNISTEFENLFQRAN